MAKKTPDSYKAEILEELRDAGLLEFVHDTAPDGYSDVFMRFPTMPLDLNLDEISEALDFTTTLAKECLREWDTPQGSLSCGDAWRHCSNRLT